MYFSPLFIKICSLKLMTVYIPEYIHLQRWLPGSGVWETFRIDDVKH